MPKKRTIQQEEEEEEEEEKEEDEDEEDEQAAAEPPRKKPKKTVKKKQAKASVQSQPHLQQLQRQAATVTFIPHIQRLESGVKEQLLAMQQAIHELSASLAQSVTDAQAQTKKEKWDPVQNTWWLKPAFEKLRLFQKDEKRPTQEHLRAIISQLRVEEKGWTVNEFYNAIQTQVRHCRNALAF